MKKILVFLLLSFSLIACKSPSVDYKANQTKARLIICSGLSEKKIPLDNLEEIIVNEGDKIYFYTMWFNLSKENHITSLEILDESNNYLIQNKDYSFKSNGKTHNTWSSRIFREVYIPEGTIKIRVNLDQQLVLEQKVNVKYIDN